MLTRLLSKIYFIRIHGQYDLAVVQQHVVASLVLVEVARGAEGAVQVGAARAEDLHALPEP